MVPPIRDFFGRALAFCQGWDAPRELTPNALNRISAKLAGQIPVEERISRLFLDSPAVLVDLAITPTSAL